MSVINCKKCNADMNFKSSGFGNFYGCSRFPKCKFTIPADQNGKILSKEDIKTITINYTKKGNKWTAAIFQKNARLSSALGSGDTKEEAKEKALKQYRHKIHKTNNSKVLESEEITI